MLLLLFDLLEMHGVALQAGLTSWTCWRCTASASQQTHQQGPDAEPCPTQILGDDIVMLVLVLCSVLLFFFATYTCNQQYHRSGSAEVEQMSSRKEAKTFGELKVADPRCNVAVLLALYKVVDVVCMG